METLNLLDQRGSGDPAHMTEQQHVLMTELIAVQARIDAELAALWDLEKRLLERIRQGPPSITTSPAAPAPSAPEPIGASTPWQRSTQTPARQTSTAA